MIKHLYEPVGKDIGRVCRVRSRVTAAVRVCLTSSSSSYFAHTSSAQKISPDDYVRSGGVVLGRGQLRVTCAGSQV